MTSPGYVDLLISILGGTPKLDGALCYNRASEWTLLPQNDPARGPQAARAIGECKRCPALRQCRMLLDGLDDPPENMICAGRILAKAAQPRKAALAPRQSSRSLVA